MKGKNMNSSLDELIEKKFKKLFDHAEKIIADVGWSRDYDKLSANPNPIEYNSWKTEARNVIKRLCGEDSEHYKEFLEVTKNWKSEVPFILFPKYYGILKGTYNDFKEGLLIDIKHRVRAELIDDFLEQAKVLLDDGFKHAAASLAGAVLEDTLRKLCDINLISYPKKTKIDSLNIELARNGIYDKVNQKLITAYADIRNNADHGHFEKIRKEDVSDMINWIYKFISKYF